MPGSAAPEGSAGERQPRGLHRPVEALQRCPEALGHPRVAEQTLRFGASGERVDHDDLSLAGGALEPRREVHRLAEVVERAVGRDDVRGSGMHAELEQHALPVGVGGGELRPGGLRGQGGAQRGRLVGEGGHHGVPDGLHDDAALRGDRALEQVEVVLDEPERAGVPDPRIEGGRAGEIGEQQGDARDGQLPAGSEHLALTEQPDQRRGAGAYLFSVAHPVAGNPWLLWEAPHPYYDLRTGEIAAALYFNPPPGPTPAAFFTSSLHRYTQADGKREKRSKNPADPCHSETHLFNVATIAAAQAFSQATVVQLHGFASSDDEGNRPPEGAIVVVSDGDRDAPSPLASAAAARLGSILGPGVLLYPLQSAALGATTNVEGRALAGIPGSRFLHVEMAGQLRDLLVQDPSRRDAVGAALFALANDPLPSSPP